MAMFLRKAGAFVLGSVFTGAALASPAMDAAFNLPEWSESCAIPSVTASSAVMHDDSVQTVSDSEPAAADKKDDTSTGCNQCSSCNSCNECPQCTCCCCCPPMWYASAGAVILHRSRPDSGIVVGDNPFTGTSFSSPSDFRFGWDAGPDVTLGYRLNCCDSIEGRFFDDDGASDNNNFVTPGNFIGAGFTGPGGTNFTGRYTTQLYSSELNWRHKMNDQVTFITGFRWIDLADEMDYRLNTTVAEGDYKYTNQLYGGQLGVDYKLTDRCNPLQIDAVGKAGLYGNQSNGGIYEFQGANRNFIGSFTGVDTDPAFVGELDFTATYQVTCHMSVHGGYELLWMSKVALAGDAASRSLLNPSLLRVVDNDQNLFYNGATAGIDFVW
jgi:Putative beta barrel porin-7 (BBP7)